MEMDLLHMLLILCPLVFFASFVDSIAGGGGLISLPAYMLTGIPAQAVIGTNKFSAGVGTVISTVRFVKSGNFHLKTALETAAFSVIGAVAGAELAIHISDYYLRMAMLVLLPCVAVFVLFNRKNIADESRFETLSKTRVFFSMMGIGLTMGVYDGFFGPGTGTFLILAFSTILQFDMKRACGNTKIVNLTTNISALVMYLLAGHVVFALAIPAAAFSILGNYIGSGLAIKNGEKIVRPIMMVVLCLLLVKLISDMVR